jgi:hypothetical protein
LKLFIKICLAKLPARNFNNTKEELPAASFLMAAEGLYKSYYEFFHIYAAHFGETEF